MSLPLWGSLEKSQDDAETIEEAINRIVLEHNNDPESHLGTDESLQAHKTDAVIDHPAGSVLPDKWTLSDFDFETSFENLSAFITTGTVSSYFPGAILRSSSSGSGGRSYLALPLEDQSFVFFPAKSFLFQFIFNADTFQDGSVYMNFGYTGTTFGKSGLGLKIIDEVATFYTSEYDGTGGSELAWPGYTDISDMYVVRIQHNAGDGYVSFFANGELIGTLPWPIDPDATDVMGIYFATQKDGATDAQLLLKSLFFSVGV